MRVADNGVRLSDEAVSTRMQTYQADTLEKLTAAIAVDPGRRKTGRQLEAEPLM